MVGEPIDGIQDGAFDGAVRTLMRDLRDKLGPNFAGPGADPMLDITETPSADYSQEARIPQITVTDLSWVMTRAGGIEEYELSRDLDAMTADVTPAPDLYAVTFTLTVVAKLKAGARRMAEDLDMYFTRRPHTLVMDVSDEYGGGQVEMRKELVGEFKTLDISNEGGVIFIEGRGRLHDVPVFDASVEKRYLVKTVRIGISDKTTGKSLAGVEVNAADEQ